jgi:hypothetical protein
MDGQVGMNSCNQRIVLGYTFVLTLCSVLLNAEVCTGQTNEFPESLAKYNISLAKFDIAIGGSFAVYRDLGSTALYFTNEFDIFKNPANAGKFSGLWRTDDYAQSWKRVGCFSSISSALILPETEEIFIVAVARPFETDGKGHVRTKIRGKLLRSMRGVFWRDATPKRAYLEDPIECIFPDPNHPRRVCLYTAFGDVLQSLDDECSRWKHYSAEEWAKKYGAWDWSLAYPPQASDAELMTAEDEEAEKAWHIRSSRFIENGE